MLVVDAQPLVLSDADRARFESKIQDFADCSPRLCWRWIGTYSKNRVPLFTFGGNDYPAFRVLNGMIGPRFGFVRIRRRCRNHECVNPWHLHYPRSRQIRH